MGRCVALIALVVVVNGYKIMDTDNASRGPIHKDYIVQSPVRKFGHRNETSRDKGRAPTQKLGKGGDKDEPYILLNNPRNENDHLVKGIFEIIEQYDKMMI